jgi:GNAT superfamily N-acetyltransferase
MELTIRRLTIDDYDDIIRVWSDAGLPHKPKGRDSRGMMTKEMAHPSVAYFGLFEDVLLIGVGLANFDGRRGWINRVAIDPDRRGIGLAGRLIDACEEFLRSIGAVVICALIEEVNTPSMSCFEKAGFRAEREYVYWTKRSSPDL